MTVKRALSIPLSITALLYCVFSLLPVSDQLLSVPVALLGQKPHLPDQPPKLLIHDQNPLQSSEVPDFPPKILLIGSLTFHFCLALCYMHLAVFQIG